MGTYSAAVSSWLLAMIAIRLFYSSAIVTDPRQVPSKDEKTSQEVSKRRTRGEREK
jgi:hypothetical protein